MFVTFLSDFGLEDEFVGVCHGVVKQIAPEAQIIDVTHGIPPQDVLRGALALADALPYLPAGVHLAIVDPGVGSERRGLALGAADRLFVGPDNGLLLPAAERAGGVDVAHELTGPSYRLEPVSRTFHGRDVFAPAAAHLARGVPISELGPPLDPASLARLDIPRPELREDELVARVLAVDRFGNLQLALARDDLVRLGIPDGGRVEAAARDARLEAVTASTYADAGPGRPLLYEDSSGRMALAVAGGSAAEALDARAGDVLRLRPALQ